MIVVFSNSLIGGGFLGFESLCFRINYWHGFQITHFFPAKWFIINLKGSGLSWISELCFLLLPLLSVAVLMGTSSASLSETCLVPLWPLLVITVTGTSAAVVKEQGLRTIKIGSGCSSSSYAWLFAVSLEASCLCLSSN